LHTIRHRYGYGAWRLVVIFSLLSHQQGDCMQKITPFLWFDSQAEEAANYYVSLFKNSGCGNALRLLKPSNERSVVPTP
jgi:3-demethylubiquinone-9 3-methyltransferase